MAVYSIIPDLFALDLFAKNDIQTLYLNNHRLTGSVKTNGAITSNKRVSVLEQGTTKLVDVATSDNQGVFEMKGINSMFDGVALTLVVTDEQDVYNALVADNVKLVGINEVR